MYREQRQINPITMHTKTLMYTMFATLRTEHGKWTHGTINASIPRGDLHCTPPHSNGVCLHTRQRITFLWIKESTVM